jgi:iron complex transport system ATP-binding protein
MELENLSFQYGKQTVLDAVSARIGKGKITTIIGANGSGKTTLLYLMTKNLKPVSGGVYLDGKNIQQIRLRDFSRQVAIVHQSNSAPNDVTVKSLVAYGRSPHDSFYRRRTGQDEEIVSWAMQVTNVYNYRDRPISTLSSGQRQRVWIAMALAQKTEILMLDEPTTYLDIRYQVQILNLIRNLNQELGMTIVMVLHDINQALCYSDEVIGLKEGRVIVQGGLRESINNATLQEIFDVNLKVLEMQEHRFVLAV